MFDERYEIIEFIGSGKLAELYKAVDNTDGKIVAVKILKSNIENDNELRHSFVDVTNKIMKLSHPYIAKIYDAKFNENDQYIIMEYVEGYSLRALLDHADFCVIKDAVYIVIQILRALQNAHFNGIIHRDLRPQNILIDDDDGKVKVKDFGIDYLIYDNRTGLYKNKIQNKERIYYISPEVAEGLEADERSDIYSVGVMMYEMLTGSKPFDGEPEEIINMHINESPERLKTLVFEMKFGLEEIIVKAMEKNPDNRYQNVSEMIEDIEAFMQNPEISFGYYKENEDGDLVDCENLDNRNNVLEIIDMYNQIVNDAFKYQTSYYHRIKSWKEVDIIDRFASVEFRDALQNLIKDWTDLKKQLNKAKEEINDWKNKYKNLMVQNGEMTEQIEKLRKNAALRKIHTFFRITDEDLAELYK